MLRSINATSKIKRRPKRKEVSRSFRIGRDIDRALDEEAVRKGWTKSFLIRDIIRGWFTYRQAREKVEGASYSVVETDAEPKGDL